MDLGQAPAGDGGQGIWDRGFRTRDLGQGIWDRGFGKEILDRRFGNGDLGGGMGCGDTIDVEEHWMRRNRPCGTFDE